MSWPAARPHVIRPLVFSGWLYCCRTFGRAVLKMQMSPFQAAVSNQTVKAQVLSSGGDGSGVCRQWGALPSGPFTLDFVGLAKYPPL